ncbi:Nif3-like dinuclear metal center hexameric protein [Haliscomenobacter sp.]|uniref:Nif3-like dinuclear metal center hexameric protein n=1 Tax=Haliscomenobacter sp. TaxID=2717303 RepID=UPI00359363D6
MPTTISELTTYLESIAPSHYQEDYDNSGLLVGDPNTPITGVMIALDATEAVIDEAVAKGCNLLVAHHPIIFRGLKRLTGRNYVERVVIKAIREGVALYAIHTNLDNVYRSGVNGKIAEKLGLENTRILAAKPLLKNGLPAPDPEVGSGMIGTLPQSMSEIDFLQHLKSSMQVGCIKYTPLGSREVRTVAVCGGSGGFLLPKAIAAGADVFVTADYKYHEFFDADGQIVIADIGHYESEQFTIELLHEIISKKYSNFARYCTSVKTNPVHYY